SLLALFFAMMAPKPDEEAITAAKAALLGNFAILNTQLSGQDYVCGSFSIADIALGCLTPISFNLGLDLTPYSYVIAWLKRLRARPAWGKAETIVADMAAGQAQLA
ncbi:MAG: glutathione binding-like protein, partial [Rugosibacter sp.]